MTAATPKPSGPRIGRPWRIVVGTAVVLAVAVLFGVTLAGNADALSTTDVTPGWWALGAVAVFVVAVAISGWLWGRVLGVLEPPRIGVGEAVRVHFGAWIMKYIPGQVGSVLYKISWAADRGRSKTSTAVSVVYENAFLLIGSIVPMLGILVVYGLGDVQISGVVWVAAGAMLPLAVLMHPVVFRRVVSLLGARRLGRELPAQMFLPTGRVVTFQLAYLLPRVANGIGIAVIAAAVAGAAPSTWVPLAAAYAIAGAVGILAVFVPSGLGVREAVFVLFASPYLGAETAIVVSIVARVLATVADGVIGIVFASASGGRLVRKDTV